jgi:DNA-binding transcriptional ArsR family regulator
MKLGQLNTSQVVEQVGGNYCSVRRHLEVLKEEGILEMTPYGSRIRFYKFNPGSPKANAVQALLQAWKQ